MSNLDEKEYPFLGILSDEASHRNGSLLADSGDTHLLHTV